MLILEMEAFQATFLARFHGWEIPHARERAHSHWQLGNWCFSREPRNFRCEQHLLFLSLSLSLSLAKYDWQIFKKKFRNRYNMHVCRNEMKSEGNVMKNPHATCFNVEFISRVVQWIQRQEFLSLLLKMYLSGARMLRKTRKIRSFVWSITDLTDEREKKQYKILRAHKVDHCYRVFRTLRWMFIPREKCLVYSSRFSNVNERERERRWRVIPHTGPQLQPFPLCQQIRR